MKVNSIAMLLFGFIPYINSCDLIAQKVDTSTSKWVNYNRRLKESVLFSDPVFKEQYLPNKTYITNQKDTLERFFATSSYRDHGHIIYETSHINGQANGLSIGYHPNGQVFSVNYYYNNKLWETISLIDSSGRPHDPGSLVNGTGTVPYLSNDGRNLGYKTYENGYPNGPYYYVDGTTAVKGDVRYRPACVNYYPGYKVTYVNQEKDTVTAVFDSTDYMTFFMNSNDPTGIKLISATPDSLIESSPNYPWISEIFSYSEVVPVGKWRIFNVESNQTNIEIEYDGCGNEIVKIFYNDDGSIRDKKTFSPSNKRKRTTYYKNN